MPSLYTVDLSTIEEVITNGTDLNDKVVYVEVKTSNYHDIGEGIMDIFSIKVADGEYTVKDKDEKIMVETATDTITVRQLSTNPYVKDYLQVFDVSTDATRKKEEVLQAINMLAFKGVAFGGEQPYLELLKRVLIGAPEGAEDSEEVVTEPEPTEPVTDDTTTETTP